jgi:putative DNA primase/helicase
VTNSKTHHARNANGHAGRQALAPPPSLDGGDAQGSFKLTPQGVFTSDGIFLCSPLKVTAYTRTKESEEWGLLLEWSDADGVKHQFSMPAGWLGGDGRQILEVLLRGGVRINHAKRNLIAAYLHSQRPTQRVIQASHIGWHDRTYVLPDTSIPESADRVLYQTPGEHRYYVRGTEKNWRDTIARLCAGNSRLVFSASCAFAAPLLKPLELEGGGFHIAGQSSTGKTTAQYVAGSVCGGGSHGQSFKRSWRATQSGIEATAEGHNDCLLLLDEIREMTDPKELDSMVYMLANGTGKNRATKENTARRMLAWRLLIHSTGEIKLSEYAGAAGSKVKAGAQVRLVNIPADAGRGMGLFENLHGAAGAREFAEQLHNASTQQYGTAFRAFLQNFVRDYDGNVAWLKKQMDEFQKIALPPEARPGAAPEVGRALTRFALVAAAGEMATKFGITGWKCGESRSAAVRCFRDWIHDRGGTGQSDLEEGIIRVRYFLQTKGSSCFQSTRINTTTGGIDEERIVQRAGYWRVEDGERWYLIFPEVWEKDVCQGYDPRQIAKALAERGGLKKGEGSNLTRKESVPEGRRRFYVVSADL